MHFTTGNNISPAVTATEIDFLTAMPLYPSASPSGYATIVPVRKKEDGSWPTKKEVLAKALEVKTPLTCGLNSKLESDAIQPASRLCPTYINVTILELPTCMAIQVPLQWYQALRVPSP